MTRIGKQEERRHRSPKKCKAPAEKSGSKKDNLPKGFKEHANALSEKEYAFVPKIK